MEKLTEKRRFKFFRPDEETTTVCVDGYFEMVENDDDFFDGKETHYYLAGEAIDRLAEYEDLEEQGLLLRMRFKVGEDVWCLKEYEDGFYYSGYIFLAMCGEYCITTAHYLHLETLEEHLEEMVDECENWGYAEMSIFHKSRIFRTREEAKKALAEMGAK